MLCAEIIELRLHPANKMVRKVTKAWWLFSSMPQCRWFHLTSARDWGSGRLNLQQCWKMDFKWVNWIDFNLKSWIQIQTVNCGLASMQKSGANFLVLNQKLDLDLDLSDKLFSCELSSCQIFHLSSNLKFTPPTLHSLNTGDPPQHWHPSPLHPTTKSRRLHGVASVSSSSSACRTPPQGASLARPPGGEPVGGSAVCVWGGSGIALSHHSIMWQ